MSSYPLSCVQSSFICELSFSVLIFSWAQTQSPTVYGASAKRNLVNVAQENTTPLPLSSQFPSSELPIPEGVTLIQAATPDTWLVSSSFLLTSHTQSIIESCPIALLNISWIHLLLSNRPLLSLNYSNSLLTGLLHFPTRCLSIHATHNGEKSF